MSEQRGPVVAVAAGPDGLPWPQGPLESEPHGVLVGLTVPDDQPGFAAAIEQQLAALELWWPRSDGAFRWRLSANPDGASLSTRHEVETYLESSGLRAVDAATPLVLFVSAHGLAATSGRHYLRLPDTSDERLLATAVPTSALACAALDSHSRDVLVILNMCESAAVQSELISLQDDLAPTRKEEARLNVLATTERGRSVLGLELARVLSRAHLLATTSEQIAHPYLTMSEFTQLLNRAAKALEEDRPARRGRRAQARLNIPQPLLTQWQHERSRALPNPGYEPAPRVATAEVSDVAATFDELEYWLEKASGRLDKADGGWYFSGRTQLNRLLVGFVGRHRGTMIVTGGAGSGKSALLGRMVTLRDPLFRGEERYKTAFDAPPDTIPPPLRDEIGAAVSARNHTALTVLRQLGRALGCRPAQGDELGDWQSALEAFLARPGQPVTVVVDSLDEAYDPTHLITTALAPFVAATRPGPGADERAGLPGQARPGQAGRRRRVRLLLGVRSARPTPCDGARRAAADDLLAELAERFPHAETVRCDDDPGQDIKDYVRVLLRDQEQWTEPAVGQAAAVVAGRAGGSFLHARLAVEQLRARGPQLLARRDWLDRVGQGITGLLRTDIELAAAPGSGLTATEALGLLRASAFALGRGVAWGDVWPALAHAVLQAPLRDPDEKIRRLLKSRLAGYLTSDHEDDRVVYRPAHEQLAQILRRWPTPERPPP